MCDLQELSHHHHETPKSFVIDGQEGRMVHTVLDLSPNTSYEFVIRAENQRPANKGANSSAIITRTLTTTGKYLFWLGVVVVRFRRREDWCDNTACQHVWKRYCEFACRYRIYVCHVFLLSIYFKYQFKSDKESHTYDWLHVT